MTSKLDRPSGERLYEIDLLRFFAALLVVMVHFSFPRDQSRYDFSTTLGPVGQYGYLGVDLFFMISGMVVLMSAWGRNVADFVASRVSRLYPAYWVAVTLTALTVAVAHPAGRSDVTPIEYIANMTMFAQLGDIEYVENVYWTLWSEWRFYLILLGFIFIGITVHRTHLLMWGWLAISVGLQSLPIPAGLYDLLALIVQPSFSHYFIAGMALYLVHRFKMTVNLATLLIACSANAIKESPDRIAERVAEGQSPSSVVVAIAIISIFVVMTATAAGWLRWMRWPGFAAAGAMTYPLYLIHVTVGLALLDLLHPVTNPFVALLLVVVLMCGLSWLISTQVEDRVRPGLQRSLRLTLNGRRRPARSVVSAPPDSQGHNRLPTDPSLRSR